MGAEKRSIKRVLPKPENCADYNSRPSVPVQFFPKLRPPQSRAEGPGRFPGPRSLAKHIPQTALALAGRRFAIFTSISTRFRLQLKAPI